MTSPHSELLGSAAPFIDVVEVDPADVAAWWARLQATAERICPSAVLRLIEASRCTTADGFFGEVAGALEFPSYFGRNWAAFEDCVNDLGWLPAPAYVIVVHPAESLFSQTSPENFAALDAVLNAGAPAAGPTPGAAAPGDTVVPLRLVLVAADAEMVARRMREAGVRLRVHRS